METADTGPTAEELLRHARWLRRMAGALLRDEAAAEDLVQDTWLAALSRAPGTARLRPWLREVARNFARQRHRGKARRAARELAARPPGAPEAPDEFATRLEAEQRLSRELAALAEPFRSTLMLRYYEDLEPAEIAARLGLPGGTVRWRLARALELLRARLDEAHGGDRRAWSLALLPLARFDGVAGVTAAATTASVLSGVLAMNVLKLSIGAAALLVVALGLSLAGVLPEELTLGRRERPLEVQFRPLEPTEPEAPTTLAAQELAVGAERAALGASASAVDAAPSVATRSAALDGRIVSGVQPLAGARLVRRGDAPFELLSGSDGRVQGSFALLEERELVRFELSAPGHATRSFQAVFEAGQTTHLGRMELARGGAVSGHVRDEAGRPVADALVTLGLLDEPYSLLEERRLHPPGASVPAARSDERGAFRLVGVPVGMVRLWAHAAGTLASYTPPLEVRASQESLGVELVLQALAPENVLRGVVLAPTGAPVPRAELEFRHASRGGSSVRSGTTRSDEAGRFEFLLSPGTSTSLRAADPEGRWSAATLDDLPTGPLEQVLQLSEARVLELVVTGRDGAPLERFSVELRGVLQGQSVDELAADLGLDPASVLAEFAPRLGGLAAGEHAGGRARVALPDQPFHLEVFAPAHRPLQLGPFDPARLGASLSCRLEPVAGLAGVVLRGGEPVAGVRVELRAEVEPDRELVANGFRQRFHPDVRDDARTDDAGRFVLTARVPGVYFVRAVPARGAPAEVGPLEVGASLGGPPLEVVLGGAIEGRVRLAGGVEPEGAIVGLTRGDGSERTRRAGADGRFRFEDLLPGPWRVELRSEEVFGPATSISSTKGPNVRPFELAANCVVREGETVWVEVGDVPPEGFAFEGRLLLDERPAAGWTAKLGPPRSLELDGEGWQALDADGRFQLTVPGPGEYRLSLRQRGGEFQEVLLFEDLRLDGSQPSWERALHTGKLRLSGLAAWNGEGPPPVVFFWRGSGQLFGLAVGFGDTQHPLVVFAGNAELRSPGKSMDPDTWKVLREITVPRAGELALELEPADLER